MTHPDTDRIAIPLPHRRTAGEVGTLTQPLSLLLVEFGAQLDIDPGEDTPVQAISSGDGIDAGPRETGRPVEGSVVQDVDR